MSLETKNLTKIYGIQTAAKEVTISIQPGEIVGFLGPNGAGKSTTMKMITGFVTPTSGSVKVDGIDMLVNPLEAKKRIGYLPEHNPLYLDMYVKEFLDFTARLHGLNNLKERVNEVIRITGLKLECHKRLLDLSKGYRQRVGIAQAIIHNPSVLILDEPTSGLDPNQLKEIRQLIKEIGQDKTVLFSSHILQEVQALCDRIIIIKEGTIIADCSIGEVDALVDGNRALELELEKPIQMDDLRSIVPAIDHIELVGNVYTISFKKETDIRRALFNYVKEKDNAIMGMNLRDTSIESVFASLTSESL
ncbi:MAG: ATP-binding cassette domain-containing protein [Bacteroidia bacterium]|nr:ATP-binding cassette domain-containing protein [Bacteroidia bacterium]